MLFDKIDNIGGIRRQFPRGGALDVLLQLLINVLLFSRHGKNQVDSILFHLNVDLTTNNLRLYVYVRTNLILCANGLQVIMIERGTFHPCEMSLLTGLQTVFYLIDVDDRRR